jgi:hypothetical protein
MEDGREGVLVRPSVQAGAAEVEVRAAEAPVPRVVLRGFEVFSAGVTVPLLRRVIERHFLERVRVRRHAAFAISVPLKARAAEVEVRTHGASVPLL